MNRYSLYFKNKQFILSLIIGILFLLFSFVINHYAVYYATLRSSSPVTDIILSNIRAYDVDAIFLYGPVVFVAFIVFLCVLKPQVTLFTVKSIALFICVRAIFISLTHIGPFPTHITLSESDIWGIFTFYDDLFFSGHTGLPFLLALIFYENIYLRFFFFLCSIIGGAIVLLGHLHYSIDVFAAFFITYSIFRLAEIFFKKDRKIFFTNSGNNNF